jgi:hypothetical protein
VISLIEDVNTKSLDLVGPGFVLFQAAAWRATTIIIKR